MKIQYVIGVCKRFQEPKKQCFINVQWNDLMAMANRMPVDCIFDKLK